MALTSKEKSRIYRAKMADNGVKELRGIEVPILSKDDEKAIKERIRLLIKQDFAGNI